MKIEATLLDVLNQGAAQLASADVDDPALDARLLTAHALNCDRAALLTQNDRILTPEETDLIQTLIKRRANREPIARILNHREFWSLPFALNEATLDPRPDSEVLVETALTHIANLQPPAPSPSLLDLGTGSGCLLLALLHEMPTATGLGIDIAPRAVEQAQDNAARLGLEKRARFRTGSWFEGVEEKFDIILSNPPYIASETIPTLMQEVRTYDPLKALDGGKDGLDPYRHIIPRLKDFLNPRGLALFEIGMGQEGDVKRLFQNHGFSAIGTAKDLAGITRCVYGRFA